MRFWSPFRSIGVELPFEVGSTDPVDAKKFSSISIARATSDAQIEEAFSANDHFESCTLKAAQLGVLNSAAKKAGKNLAKLRRLQLWHCVYDIQAKIQLANVLRNDSLKNLREICFELSMSNTKEIFEAMASLPFTAISLELKESDDYHNLETADLLCEMLYGLKQTLRYFELRLSPFATEAPKERLFERFEECLNPNLQALHLHVELRNLACAGKFCCALEKLSRLECLTVHFSGPHLRAFVSALTSNPRCCATLKWLTLKSFPNDRSVFMQMLLALRNRTRLQRFTSSIYVKEIEKSCLAEMGWLTALDFLESPKIFVPLSLQETLMRNRKRHESCCKACVIFIALKRKRDAMKFMAYDIVVMIAKYLFDIRNQREWDV